MLPNLVLNTVKVISHCWFPGVRADLNILFKVCSKCSLCPTHSGIVSRVHTLAPELCTETSAPDVWHFLFPPKSLQGPPAARPLSHLPPSSVFPPSPSGFIFRKCQQTDLYHIIKPLLLPVTSAFRHISMSSLRARKRSLITAAAARYNVKFLKCKCILENYSPLDLPPPPPLSHPQA